MSFHLSLSPTSSSSLTRFRPVVMPYNVNPALFKSFSTLSIHLCFGRPTGRFPSGFQLCTMCGHLSLSILTTCPYHLILLFRTTFSAISCPVLARTSTLLTISVYLMRNIRRSHRFSMHSIFIFLFHLLDFSSYVLLPPCLVPVASITNGDIQAPHLTHAKFLAYQQSSTFIKTKGHFLFINLENDKKIYNELSHEE